MLDEFDEPEETHKEIQDGVVVPPLLDGFDEPEETHKEIQDGVVVQPKDKKGSK